MLHRRTLTALAAGAVALFTGAVQAQGLEAELFANGFSRPLFVTHAPGDFERIFIVEQNGIIKVADLDGTVNATPFLNITSTVYGPNDPGGNNEEGLLGLAFHPEYQTNGRFFVNYTTSSGSIVAEYAVSTADPEVANPTRVQQIISQGQPFGNHNGGWIGFSPVDGYLYIALGDGGSGNDPQGNGQNKNTLLGKMLRIDIDGDDFPGAGQNYAIPADNPFVGDANTREEIWAYGLRNHWRNSFDRETGDLWIADVGQGSREEINAQPSTSTGGENYGWRCMEGVNCTGLSGCTCNAASLTMPFYDYSRSGGNCSITGGYVYRGCAIPSLYGQYIYADYCSTDIFTFTPNAALNNFTGLTDRTSELEPAGSPSIGSLASFGEDAYGELYILDLFGGEIFKIVPDTSGPLTDCDMNGVEDDCEIADMSGDMDENGLVDACEIEPCTADFDNDGDVDLTDFGTFGAAFGSMTGDANYSADADFDNDGDVDLTDFGTFGSEFGRMDCP